MYSAVGVFSTWQAAEQAVKKLGLPEDRFIVIARGRRDPEETGIGGPLGGVVGGAVGAAAGSVIGTAAASLMLPGVGPVVATGLATALLLGAGGAALGAAAGEEVEESTDVHPPAGDVFFCEEALRRGRIIVVALGETAEEASSIRSALAADGAERLDRTREDWWSDLRDAERATYQGDFDRDEAVYRRGFEAALAPPNRGKRLEEDAPVPDAYRKGYERGQEYYTHLALRLE